MIARTPATSRTKPQRSKSRQPLTWVESTTRCAAKSTGPPKPIPQRSRGNSRRHARAISAICATIHSRPPAASVARDSRRTIFDPSKTAMENLVPPMSMARINAGLLVYPRRLPITCLDDRERSRVNMLAERGIDLLRCKRADLLLQLLVPLHRAAKLFARRQLRQQTAV